MFVLQYENASVGVVNPAVDMIIQGIGIVQRDVKFSGKIKAMLGGPTA